MIMTMTPGAIIATILALPAILVAVAFILAPLPVLAIVLAADPADERAADSPQAGKDQVAYEAAAGCAEEGVGFRRPRVV